MHNLLLNLKPEVLSPSMINGMTLKKCKEVFHMHKGKIHSGSVSMFVIPEILFI